MNRKSSTSASAASTDEFDISDYWQLRVEQAKIYNGAEVWRSVGNADGKGPAQRIAGVLLAFYGNPKHAIMWPTQDELAEVSGCTRSKASTALTLLEDAGVLVKLSFKGQRNLAYVFTYLYQEWYARHDLPVLPKSFRSRLTAESGRKLAGVLGDDDDDAETRQEATDQSERERSSTRFEGQGTPSKGEWFEDPEATRNEPPSDLIPGVDY